MGRQITRFVILFFSTVYLLSIQNLINKKLIYQNEQQVASILKYLNENIAEKYFSTSNNVDFNSILVKPEKDYCLRSDVYKYFHPDIVLKDTYTFRELKGVIREALQSNFYDCMPNLVFKRKNSHIPPQHKLPLELTLPFLYYDQLVRSFKTGHSAMCLFQKYNHLPQRHALSHKNSLVNNFFAYIDKMVEQNLSKECINNATYIPKTYRLYNKHECWDFFNYTQSQTYKAKEQKTGPQFLTKMGLEVHRGRGITLLLPQELKELTEEYGNGTKCGQNQDLLISQTYINNPYLYQGHKIEFRFYWVFASTNPIIAYAFDKALIRRCVYPFDLHSKLKGAHVCNTAITKQTIQQNKENKENNENNDNNDNNDEDGDEGELFIDWKLDRLQEILLEEGKIKDQNWLQNYLYPKVDRSIIHAIRSAQHKFARDSKLAEFFAADFLLTDDLEIHILEMNYNPQTLKTTPQRVHWHTKMTKDMIEIQNAYLRSKYLRFKKIISKIVSKMSSKYTLKSIMNEQQMREIELAYVDKLDQGIQISKDNLFRKIMDENENGTKMYNDLIQKQCLK